MEFPVNVYQLSPAALSQVVDSHQLCFSLLLSLFSSHLRPDVFLNYMLKRSVSQGLPAPQAIKGWTSVHITKTYQNSHIIIIIHAIHVHILFIMLLLYIIDKWYLKFKSMFIMFTSCSKLSMFNFKNSLKFLFLSHK